MVYAPDLYRGLMATTIPEAEILAGTLAENGGQIRTEIAAAARFLYGRAGQTGRSLSVIGFSLGTYYGLELSEALPEQIRAVVLFYGTGFHGFARAQAEYQGHFAEDDPYEPQANVDDLEAALHQAGRPVEFYRYPGTGHWFCGPGRPEAYDAATAELAWRRTLAFLHGQPTP